MNHPTPVSAAPRPRAAGERPGRYEVLIGFLFAAALCAAIAILLAHTVLRGLQPAPVETEAFRETLRPEAREVLAPAPVQRWLFIVLALASPLCALAGLRLARLTLDHLPQTGKTAARPGFTLGGVALLAGGLGIYLLHQTVLLQYFAFITSPALDMAVLVVAAAMLYFAARRKGKTESRAFTRGPAIFWKSGLALIALIVTMLPRGLSIRSVLSTKDVSDFAWTDHFQAVAYTISQVNAGKPLLTAAPPLYGDYAEFLLPVFKLIGLSVFKVCITLGLIQAAALTAVLLLAVSHLRSNAVKLLTCAALLYFLGNTCFVGKRPYDPVFQYWPIRFIFPALSAWAYLWASKKAAPAAWIALGVFAGLAMTWNLDSGIALSAATLFVLALDFIPAPRRGAAVLSLILTGGAMFATAALCRLCLETQAGWRTPFHQTADYQRLYYQSGFMGAPIPLAPHPWWLVAAAYLLGLGFGLHRFLRGNRSVVTRLSLFLSILGIGLFTYYQGRAVESNLLNASWPAMLLAAIFTDRLIRAIRARLIPPGLCWIALPAAYLALMAAVLLPGVLVSSWNLGREQWSLAVAQSASVRADAMNRRVQFVRAHVGGDSECVILTECQAVYFVETGFRSAIDAPGLTEIYFMQDLDKIKAELIANPPKHLFVDKQNLAALQLTQIVTAHFKLIATTPDGKLFYFEPR